MNYVFMFVMICFLFLAISIAIKCVTCFITSEILSNTLCKSNFTKEMKKELQECENRLHNYQRSQEMNNTLNEAGIEDSIENNQMIVENLLDAAKEVTDGNTEIISYIEGVNGKVQVVSRWKILPDGTPYLATVILKPMK